MIVFILSKNAIPAKGKGCMSPETALFWHQIAVLRKISVYRIGYDLFAIAPFTKE